MYNALAMYGQTNSTMLYTTIQSVMGVALLFAMQCSAGNNRFRSNPCNTDGTEGLCTSCSTNRWDYGTRGEREGEGREGERIGQS